MRTSFAAGWLALVVVVAVPVAVADPTSMRQFADADGALEAVDGLVPLDLRADGARPEASGSDDVEPSSPAAKVADAAAIPVALLSKGLVQIGLGLIQGFFTGIAEGAQTFDAALVTIAESPAKSVAIAGITTVAIGLLSLLTVLSQRYGGLAAIPLFSRIAKADILNNRLRADVFELIQQNPGIHVSEISARLNIAWGTCTHHLQKLRDEKMVAIRTVGHQKCYFPNGGSYTPREMEVLSATKNPTAKRIAQFLVENGPRSHGEIAQQLALSPALVSFHASKLVASGILGREREGRRTIFHPMETNLQPAARPMVHSV